MCKGVDKIVVLEEWEDNGPYATEWERFDSVFLSRPLGNNCSKSIDPFLAYGSLRPQYKRQSKLSCPTETTR